MRPTEAEAARARRRLLLLARKASPALHKTLRAISLLALPARPRGSLVQVMGRSIVGQQVASKVAQTFWRRLEEAAAAEKQPVEMLFEESRRAQLRAMGISGSKISYLCALREAHEAGLLQSRFIMQSAHEARVKQLTQIRGIGRWTVDMLGIFYCRDADIWPEGDLAVRQMFAQLTDTPEKGTREPAALFAPYRSYLALYMWRARNLGYTGAGEKRKT